MNKIELQWKIEDGIYVVNWIQEIKDLFFDARKIYSGKERWEDVRKYYTINDNDKWNFETKEEFEILQDLVNKYNRNIEYQDKFNTLIND